MTGRTLEASNGKGKTWEVKVLTKGRRSRGELKLLTPSEIRSARRPSAKDLAESIFKKP